MAGLHVSLAAFKTRGGDLTHDIGSVREPTINDMMKLTKGEHCEFEHRSYTRFWHGVVY